MKTFSASLLAFAIAAASGAAAAQSVEPVPFDRYDSQGSQYQSDRNGNGNYDYARVVRVVPVGGNAGYSSARNCRSRDYEDDGYYGGYGNDGYQDRGGYGRDGYYGRDGHSGGSSSGRAMASVVGSVIGALVGSQVGGGSGRFATSAIGSAVGAIAGQQVYENAQQQRNVGRVTVCDPVADDYRYGNANAGTGQYDVTYEYGGRMHTTRTNYHPGDRIRVRVIAE